MNQESAPRLERELSVVLCTHNPRPDYLERVLAALRVQTLALERWELLLIDSASAQPLAGRVDVSWHPNARGLRLDQPGKTRALLAGIEASATAILVLVDDDNVLAPDFLQQVARIAREHPEVGAWGGNVVLRFETPPEEWTRGYWDFLAQRHVLEDEAVCNMDLAAPLPAGAGCCVRKCVAEHYARQVATSPWRQALGRTGKTLMAGEDSDLVLTACELGLKRGLFKALSLDHLIPPERLQEKYLTDLVEGIIFSSLLLMMCRDRAKAPAPITWWWQVRFWCDCCTKFGRKRRFYLANKRAQKRARQFYESLPIAP